MALRAAADVVVERTEAGDQARVDRAQGDLVRGEPVAVIALGGDSRPAAGEIEGIAEIELVLLQILVVVPGAVVEVDVRRSREYAIADFHAAREQAVSIAMFSGRNLRYGLRQTLVQRKFDAAGRAEISCAREIRPLVESRSFHQFRDEKIQVEVALAVAVGAHIERYAVDMRGEVAAVIEIQPAQIVLVRLAGSGMLGRHHAGHDLGHFARAQQGRKPDIGIADLAFGSRPRDADLLLRTAEHDDFLNALFFLLGRSQNVICRDRQQ